MVSGSPFSGSPGGFPICYSLPMLQRLALTALTLAAQAPVDVTTVGPQVGATVTDFSLADTQGRTHSLKSAAGTKGTMLVFFRSADW